MNALWDSDARLLNAILAGDDAAWQRFILQYSNFIYRAFVRYTDDYDEKMAVYLHVLEKLREDRFARLRRFSFQAKLSTWLTVVARRLALDFLRARYGRDFALKKVRVVSLEGSGEGEPDYGRILADLRTPEAAAAAGERDQLRRQLAEALNRVMAALDDKERLALQLVYFEGLKINEAGKALRLPSPYKFLARVLKKIRGELQAQPGFSSDAVAAAFEGEAHD